MNCRAENFDTATEGPKVRRPAPACVCPSPSRERERNGAPFFSWGFFIGARFVEPKIFRTENWISCLGDRGNFVCGVIRLGERRAKNFRASPGIRYTASR